MASLELLWSQSTEPLQRTTRATHAWLRPLCGTKKSEAPPTWPSISTLSFQKNRKKSSTSWWGVKLWEREKCEAHHGWHLTSAECTHSPTTQLSIYQSINNQSLRLIKWETKKFERNLNYNLITNQFRDNGLTRSWFCCFGFTTRIQKGLLIHIFRAGRGRGREIWYNQESGWVGVKHKKLDALRRMSWCWRSTTTTGGILAGSERLLDDEEEGDGIKSEKHYCIVTFICNPSDRFWSEF